jgi:hypothetical protein
MTLSVITPSIITLSKITLSIITLSMITLSIMKLIIKTLGAMALSIKAEYGYARCHMQSVAYKLFISKVFMLKVVI